MIYFYMICAILRDKKTINHYQIIIIVLLFQIIISSIPDHAVSERLVSKVKLDNVLELPELPATDAELIMKVLLENADRQVTLPQWRIIQEAFKHCTLPLFITLTFQVGQL